LIKLLTCSFVLKLLEMDGFGDDFGQADVDPAAEFLAREQDQLAGLEDELDPISAPADTTGKTILPLIHVHKSYINAKNTFIPACIYCMYVLQYVHMYVQYVCTRLCGAYSNSTVYTFTQHRQYHTYTHILYASNCTYSTYVHTVYTV
jgi:hypothetical protein